ncbi:MAG: LPS assembly lipoprotein LptE [Akkermansiaceae bacterium]
MLPFHKAINAIKAGIILASASLVCSCSGYHLGGAKPQELREIHSIYVPMVENKTLEIKLAPQATNSLVRFINNDGAYQVSTPAQSDATLKVVIEKIDYDEFRSSRLDTLRAEELTATIHSTWQLVDNQSKVLLSGKTTGETRFFVGDNQRLSRDDSIYDAINNLSRKITSCISNGF